MDTGVVGEEGDKEAEEVKGRKDRQGQSCLGHVTQN